MSKIRLVALFVVIVIVITCAAVYAEKITIDPNLPGKRKTSEEAQVDARLSQKITYDSGYKRLYAVAEDLTQLSGVYILCGNSKKDWRVRDIPVVVCVKDMPLGKLLRAIADATHTNLSAARIGDDPKLSYRIYRSSKEEKDIDSYFQKQDEAELEIIKWRWDAMVAYGKSDKDIPDISRETKLFSKLIASLGPDAKSKMLDYETLQISGSNPATRGITDELYMLHWKESEGVRNTYGDNDNTEPTREDMDNATLHIKLENQSGLNLNLQLIPIMIGENISFSKGVNIHDLRLLPGKGFDLPPYPRGNWDHLNNDFDKPDMVYLNRYVDKDWDNPFLKTNKFDLVKPKDNKEFTLADLVRAIHSASGCNIVVEDFISHIVYTSESIEKLFKNDTTIAETLRYGDVNRNKQYYWFFNDEDKLMVGCVDNWRLHHRTMLSEEYLNSLLTKINGPGVDIDDVAHFGNLSTHSYYDWIESSKKMVCLARARLSYEALWLLYDALQPEDKLLAKSEDGLPLAKFDVNWINSFYIEQRKREGIVNISPRQSDEEKQEMAEELALKNQMMSDPQIMSTMVMRVQKTAANHRSVTSFTEYGTRSTLAPIPKGTNLYTYKMIIDVRINGEDIKITMDSPDETFPIWSSERYDEIVKELSGENKNSN